MRMVQWQSAPHRNEFLTCIVPRVICCDYFSGLVYPSGAFQLNVLMTWGMRTNVRLRCAATCFAIPVRHLKQTWK